jgi:hypothetical protein
MDDFHVDGGVVASTLIGSAITFLAWIIRVAAREALAGLKQSIDSHAHAIDSLAVEVKEMRQEVSNLKQRVTRVEAWGEADR